MKINIAEILKDCPIGTKLYSPLCGECTLHEVVKDKIFIRTCSNERIVIFDEYGRYFNDSECLILPSKENRDWNTFKVYKPKFDPKTLKPFDKVFVKGEGIAWKCGHRDNADFNAANNIRNRVLVTVLRESLLKQLGNGAFEPKKLKREKVKEVLLSFRRSLRQTCSDLDSECIKSSMTTFDYV